MKHKISILISIIIIICISNYLNRFSIKSYQFVNEDQSFNYVVIPYKERTIEMMENSYQEFKNNSSTNGTLYRAFRKNYFKFWKWYEYTNNKVYDYNYLKL